ncbi:hypothetical protein D3C84_1174660 [compost metagenome]
MLKSFLLILFFRSAAYDDNGRNSMGMNTFFEAMRQTEDLALNIATLTDDLTD